MNVMSSLLKEFYNLFDDSQKSSERVTWFIYTLIAIIIPFTSSKTSNLLRCLKSIFGFNSITRRRYYTFMASPKIPWANLWKSVWRLIPDPHTDNFILLVIDDCINTKVGKKIFACYKFFDHAAKMNQSKYPWSQNYVVTGLLKIVKGRWACLPLSFRFYHLEKDLKSKKLWVGKKEVKFQSKIKQAVEMVLKIAALAPKDKIIAVTDSWFGNNGLWKPLHEKLGDCFHLISRLRANSNLFDLPPEYGGKGRPKKYGEKLGNASQLATKYFASRKEINVKLYGQIRTVMAFERIFMVKTLKCPIRVIWVFRGTQWVALFSTNLDLSVKKIIEYYGARWKIESGFKELKRDIGSAETQTRTPYAVINHLNFCMMASSLTWIYAMKMKKTPTRKHAVNGRQHFAFSDVRKCITEEVASDSFNMFCPVPRKSLINSIVSTLLKIAA